MGKAKILRNIQGGLDEMLIIAYIVGGWVKKAKKSAYVIYGWSLRSKLTLSVSKGECFTTQTFGGYDHKKGPHPNLRCEGFEILHCTKVPFV